MDATDKGHTGLASYYTEKGEPPACGSAPAWPASTGSTPATSSPPTDAEPVRIRAPPAGQASAPRRSTNGSAGPTSRPRPRRSTRLRPGWHAVQGLRERRQRVPGRGRQAARGLQRGRRPARRLAGPGRGAGPDPHRGRPGVLPRRARPRARRRARAGRHDRQALPAQDQRRRRLRPHLLPGQERLGAVGARRPATAAADRAGPPGRDQRRAGLHREQGSVHPRRAPTASARSTSAAWSPPRSPTATPAPATPTSTPTSRSRTRSRPSTAEVARDRRPGAVQGQVSASETYNTALERHLGDALGRAVRGASERRRAQAAGARDRRRRPRPERPVLQAPASVEARRKVLAAEFQRTHGRPPTPVETLQLAQQATLETREAKHEPRSLAEQREAWHAEAVEVLGQPAAAAARWSTRALQPDRGRPRADLPTRRGSPRPPTASSTTMEGGRATWQYWHVYAEAQRQVRAANVPTDQISPARRPAGRARSSTAARCASPSPSTTSPSPHELRRVDGSSVYTVGGVHLFTSAKVLAAEQRLVAAAGRRDGYAVRSPASTWRCWNRPPTASPSTPGRPPWSPRWPPPAPGCSWRSHPPDPARPPRCAPSPAPGPTAGGNVDRPRPLSRRRRRPDDLDGRPDRRPRPTRLAKLTHSL